MRSQDLKRIVPRCNKQTALKIKDFVGVNQGRFDVLMELVYLNDMEHSMRAAWIVDMVCEKNDHLFTSHMDKVVRMLEKFVHEGVKRSLLKIISLSEIPEQHYSYLFDLSINWIMKEECPIAVKVHGMQTAFNISNKVPELQRELLLVLEDQFDNVSVGFKSRAKKLIKKLKK